MILDLKRILGAIKQEEAFQSGKNDSISAGFK
jgi:hypothetical protein